MENEFTSPQEESLKIAREARLKILDGKTEPMALLRACFTIAKNLSKKEDLYWIEGELNGKWKAEVPDYREISVPYKEGGLNTGKFRKERINLEISTLLYYLKSKQTINLDISGDKGTKVILTIRDDYCHELIERIVNKCLDFLSQTISELQYGGHLQSIFENIRKTVDSNIPSIDEEISNEMQSIYLNLISANPADWVKSCHSCRRILKFIADKLFPPSEEKYVTKDGKEMEVKDGNYINRIICYFDKVGRSISKEECLLMESYLRKVNSKVQDGEHKKNITKYESSLLAIHTYLIIAEIFKEKNNLTETK